MSDPRSRTGILVGLAAAAGVFGAAAMMSAATAPSARADDFTDIISAVDGDYAEGQTAFTTAFTDFGSSDLTPGLAAFFSGVNDDILTAPNNLALGTVEALQGETLSFTFPFALANPTTFADALTLAQADVVQGEADLASVATFLGGGSYDTAAIESLVGADMVSVLPVEELLLGAATSF
ncbi:MAG TPA: hypothetical protein VHU91_04870 [Mycobacteriales bacterium]|jgi:hypothetical protein|nr:hypothetical protein [Mycobacteriales bacterium]